MTLLRLYPLSRPFLREIDRCAARAPHFAFQGSLPEGIRVLVAMHRSIKASYHGDTPPRVFPRSLHPGGKYLRRETTHLSVLVPRGLSGHYWLAKRWVRRPRRLFLAMPPFPPCRCPCSRSQPCARTAQRRLRTVATGSSFTFTGAGVLLFAGAAGRSPFGKPAQAPYRARRRKQR